MPTYEYFCPDCQTHFEEIQKITEPAITTCPKCSKEHVQRLISASAFHLKGSGWYKTDYGSSGSSSSSSSPAKSTSSTETTTTEAKPAEAKKETKSEAAPAAPAHTCGSGCKH
ncbi:MAG: zinc ribbon domain-containing protein [Proteobacteria bacterium]|nr:zinc ribbon domain-containing protein [Pseudomonadota bacterium]